MRPLRHLDLFSGIGGFALAARWAGIETVGFCEIDDLCISVLDRHWPGVAKHRDVRKLEGDLYAGVDIITGGYPCQPFSVAGGQKAQEDQRNLWPEMRRVIAQARPAWVVCENVYGHISLGLDSVLHDLEGIGYAARPFVIPALATGANHNRDRVFIVANTAGYGRDAGAVSGRNESVDGGYQGWQEKDIGLEGCSGLRFGVDWQGGQIGRWGIEPPALRVADELPHRVDRNKMLGNAIDPMIAYQIFMAIKGVG